MATVHPSSFMGSLIGAQAYTSQLRRQYSQEDTPRAVSAGSGPAAAPRRAPSSNPTAGEIAPQANPPARPLYSATHREAPDPNARLRITPPGSHLNIIV